MSADVDEAHPHWPVIVGLLDKLGLGTHFVWTKFSPKEKREAEWLDLGTTGHFGYPQPEDTYMEATYDTSDYCDRCGIGGRQDRPFRFRKDPKSKKSHFLQLNWVFGEVFVRPEVRIVLTQASARGVGFMNPVVHKTDALIESFTQLRVLHELPPALQTEGFQPVTCRPNNEESDDGCDGGPKRYPPDTPYCGRRKYHYCVRGMPRFAREAFTEAPDIVKTHEWFGSGGSADQMILVNRRVADLILDHRWRGVELSPVQLVG